MQGVKFTGKIETRVEYNLESIEGGVIILNKTPPNKVERELLAKYKGVDFHTDFAKGSEFWIETIAKSILDWNFIWEDEKKIELTEENILMVLNTLPRADITGMTEIVTGKKIDITALQIKKD